MSTWQNLTNQQKNYYMEFYAPVENNIRQLPQDDDLVYNYTPTEGQINAVCETGDRLVRTINYRLNAHQHLAVTAWIRRHLPDHPDPLMPLPRIALI